MLFFFFKGTPVWLRLAIGVVLIVLGVLLHMLVAFIVGLLMLIVGGVMWFRRSASSGGGW